MSLYYYLPYILILLLAAGASILLSVYAWRHRVPAGSAYFAGIMAAVAEWSIMAAGELASTDIPSKITWSKLAYLGIVSVAPLWLLFAAAYAQKSQWFTRRRIVLLWIVPLIVLALALTNEWHGLIWSKVFFTNDRGFLAVYAHNVGVWINVGYSYLLILMGTNLFVRAILRAPDLYQRQVGMLLVAAIIPWISNVLYVLGISPLPDLDLTPIAFAVTGVAVAWGIFRFRMLDIVPVARDALVEKMNEGVLVLDNQGRIVDANPTAAHLIGYQGQFGKLIGQSMQIVLAPWPDLLARYRDVLDVQTEIDIHSAGSLVWLDLRISPLYDRRQRLMGRLIMLHDITRRKQVETTLQEDTRELEARNAELDAFAHTVAHDLKNPLNSVIGYSALLLESDGQTVLDSLQVELRAITRSAERMNRIIDELLLLSSVRKVEQIETAPVDMHLLVMETLNQLSSIISDCQAEIKTPHEWPSIISYAPWIEEVWINYLSNALKYGGSPPSIELGYDPVTGTPPHIRFWVRDNGAGLSPDRQAQLFTEFTRLDTTRAQGYGLGLSIVRRIISKLGGEVGVESTPGQGCTFFFTLPA